MGLAASAYKEGDDVTVKEKSIPKLQRLQSDHGGWNSDMKECWDQPCKIVQGMGNDLIIRAPTGKIYRVNSAILTPFEGFRPGDEVKIISDIEKMKELQKDHGGWLESMTQILGKYVEVIDRLPSGLYRVKLGETIWTIHRHVVESVNLEKRNQLSQSFSGVATFSEYDSQDRGFFSMYSKMSTTTENYSKPFEKPMLKPGGKVKIINDIEKVKNLQNGHGGWSDLMSLLLDQEVEIVEVFQDKDCYITKYDMEWMINPLCFVGQAKVDINFKIGDSVLVSDDIDKIKSLQQGHGGLYAELRSHLGGKGQVESILPSKDIKVSISGKSFVYNPELLTIIESPGAPIDVDNKTLSIGDKVEIIKDQKKVKDLQKGHGEWVDSLRLVLGKKGVVEYVFPDGDIRIKIIGMDVTMNPQCVVKCLDGDDETPDDIQLTNNNITCIGKQSPISDDIDRESDPRNKLIQDFFRAVKARRMVEIKQMINIVDPNSTLKQLSALHIAASEGHVDVVEFLLDKKASVNIKDKDGDTPLHMAVGKNRLDVCKILLQKGADVNCKNEATFTPIILAAGAGTIDILELLVKNEKADINLCNNENDTPLHFAVQKSRIESVKTLLRAGADIFRMNNKQFNPYHLSAMRGNVRILEVFLEEAGPSVVDLQKEDKFAAIHLVTLNNHPECLQLLINNNADINIRNNKLQTPLHLAVSQKNLACVKILVEHKADLNLKDVDGETPIHDGVRTHNLEKMRKMGAMFGMMEMYKTLQEVQTGCDNPEEIVVYLAESGAKLDIQNNRGQTSLDLCEDKNLKQQLQNILQGRGRNPDDDKQREQKPPLSTVSNNDEVDQLRRKIEALEAERQCNICLDRMRNVTFGCGHTACDICANNIFECHMCRQQIDKRIRIYD